MATIKPVSTPRGSRSAATREKLILAGEALFAEYGFDAVAVRQIAEASGQRNNSVIQYHFGDKYGLLDAIFMYRAEQISPIRMKMLRDYRLGGRVREIKDIFRLILEPELEICRIEGNLNYIRLTLYYMIHLRPKGILHPFDRQYEATLALRTALSLLHERLPYLPPDRFYFRTSVLDIMIKGAMIVIDGAGHDLLDRKNILLEDAIEMMTAAMGAPPWQE